MEKKSANILSGGFSAKLSRSLDLFCSRYVPGYDPRFFKAIVVRLFVGKENIITVYALDKLRQEGNGKSGIIHVKKFKITNVNPERLFKYFEEYNFTLSNGKYPVESMLVINK